MESLVAVGLIIAGSLGIGYFLSAYIKLCARKKHFRLIGAIADAFASGLVMAIPTLIGLVGVTLTVIGILVLVL